MISYEPLRLLLVKEKMTISDIREATGISTRASVRLNKDSGDITLEYVNRICNFLSKELKRTVLINEVLEYIPDHSGAEEEQKGN